MNDEILKKLDLLLAKSEKMEQDIKAIKDYIPTTDKVTNSQYCEKRRINRRTLDKWFNKGCPREGNRHVSIKAVDQWARENNTRKVLEQ